MVVSPAVEQLIAESEALTAVLACVEGTGNREEADRLVEQALRGHSDASLEGVLTQFAMERIVGEAHGAVPQVEPASEPFERQLFETTALAWIRWATGTELERAQGALRDLQEVDGYQPQGGALHLMTLRPWQLAVEALLGGNSQEARRLFKRSTELGGQCGTETNPAVQWTYASSFYLDLL
jgi:hypothetical protein